MSSLMNSIRRSKDTSPRITAEDLLQELVEAINPLTVKGTSLKLCDTRLHRAMMDAEKYLNAQGVIPDCNPRPRIPVHPSRESTHG